MFKDRREELGGEQNGMKCDEREKNEFISNN